MDGHFTMRPHVKSLACVYDCVLMFRSVNIGRQIVQNMVLEVTEQNFRPPRICHQPIQIMYTIDGSNVPEYDVSTMPMEKQVEKLKSQILSDGKIYKDGKRKTPHYCRNQSYDILTLILIHTNPEKPLVSQYIIDHLQDLEEIELQEAILKMDLTLP